MIAERMYEQYQDAVNVVHQNCKSHVEKYCNVNHVHLPLPSIPKKPLHSKDGLGDDELPVDGVNMNMTNWEKAEHEPEPYFGDVDEGEDNMMIFVRDVLEMKAQELKSKYQVNEQQIQTVLEMFHKHDDVFRKRHSDCGDVTHDTSRFTNA